MHDVAAVKVEQSLGQVGQHLGRLRLGVLDALGDRVEQVASLNRTQRWRGVVVSGVRRMNEVNARRARLVPGRVTVRLRAGIPSRYVKAN